VKTRSS